MRLVELGEVGGCFNNNNWKGRMLIIIEDE